MFCNRAKNSSGRTNLGIFTVLSADFRPRLAAAPLSLFNQRPAFWAGAIQSAFSHPSAKWLKGSPATWQGRDFRFSAQPFEESKKGDNESWPS
jgi:hypothetical protein